MRNGVSLPGDPPLLTVVFPHYMMLDTAWGAFAESPSKPMGNPSNLIRVIPAQGGGELFEPCHTWRGFFILAWKRRGISKMTDRQIKIVLNGRDREISSGTTVSGLLRELGLPETRVAVERNAEIVRKPAFGGTEIGEGDRLEIVTLVGGG